MIIHFGLPALREEGCPLNRSALTRRPQNDSGSPARGFGLNGHDKDGDLEVLVGLISTFSPLGDEGN